MPAVMSLKHRLVSGLTHLELLQVGGTLPVLVVADAGAAREADGDPVRSVRLSPGELGPGDLPHWGFLNTQRSQVTLLCSLRSQPTVSHHHHSPPQHSSIVTN